MKRGTHKRTKKEKERLRNLNKGRKFTPEHRAKIALALSGKNHFQWGKQGADTFAWKGNKVGYVGVHVWVVRYKGRPNICSKCGVTKLNARAMHWANIDHKYRRVLDDYIRLCVKCHYEYDLEKGLRTPLH